MPCTITGSLEGDRALSLSEDNAKLQELATKMTRLACEAMTIIEKSGIAYSHASTELEQWWKEHKRIDAMRTVSKAEKRQRESLLRENALRKLTDDEKHVLGLDFA